MIPPGPTHGSAPSASGTGLAENDTQPTIGEGGNRVWLYPREVRGRKTDLRRRVAWVLLAFYLGVPWLRWNGAPWIQVDVFQSRLLLLGQAYYPQDLKLFLPGFLAFIVLVFLFTAKFGRAWCGWACPQTVFLQFVFAPLERWVEGRASARRARDASGFTPGWLWRKAAKHALFFAVSFVIGNTALAYFWGRDNVLWAVSHPPSANPAGFAFVAAFSLGFYWIFAFFREQACVLVCPYARFQSVLLDERSLVVGYDARRGEKRGRGDRGLREGLGDCVDCGQCVKVCPTGIDIRKGQQLECLACARCADACDEVMKAWKKPAGLIRYDSPAGLEGLPAGGARKRLLAYAALASVLAAFSAFLILTRPEVAVDVVRRGADPYALAGKDSVLNTFTLHVRNKGARRREYSLRVAGPFRGRHNWEERRFAVGAGQMQTLQLDVLAAHGEFRFGKRELELEIEGGGARRKFKTMLVGPFGNP